MPDPSPREIALHALSGLLEAAGTAAFTAWLTAEGLKLPSIAKRLRSVTELLAALTEEADELAEEAMVERPALTPYRPEEPPR